MNARSCRVFRSLLLILSLLLSNAAAGAQEVPQWTAPYPQLPQYRELIGRLYTEAPPTNRRVPDITSKGVIAAGTFTPAAAARPGDVVASYASLTYARNALDLPDFSDLRVIAREVIELRLRSTQPAPAFERRTAMPSAEFQACVDRQMVMRMYQLDARWRAIDTCRDMLSWSDWGDADAGTVATFTAASTAAPATTDTYRWVQPYPDAPDYREFTGRLFGEASAANTEARFDNLTTPSAVAVGTFRSRARPGDTVVSYNIHFFNLDANNARNIADLRITPKDLIEVRFLLAGDRGVNFDIRKGATTPSYQRCLDARLPRFMYLPDARWRAMAECERTAAWSWWVRTDALPFSGTYTIDPITSFDYEWDAKAGVLRLMLR